jgi:hypothetical protein
VNKPGHGEEGGKKEGRKEEETGRRESERLTPPGKEDLFVRRLCISFVFISMLCRAIKFLCEHSLRSPSLHLTALSFPLPSHLFHYKLTVVFVHLYVYPSICR